MTTEIPLLCKHNYSQMHNLNILILFLSQCTQKMDIQVVRIKTHALIFVSVYKLL